MEKGFPGNPVRGQDGVLSRPKAAESRIHNNHGIRMEFRDDPCDVFRCAAAFHRQEAGEFPLLLKLVDNGHSGIIVPAQFIPDP